MIQIGYPAYQLISFKHAHVETSVKLVRLFVWDSTVIKLRLKIDIRSESEEATLKLDS